MVGMPMTLSKFEGHFCYLNQNMFTHTLVSARSLEIKFYCQK